MSALEQIVASQAGSLPGILDFEWLEVRKGVVRGRVDGMPKHLSPHGFLHGATIVAPADSACGFGCLASLPDGAHSSATAEFKTNFMGAARNGFIYCDAHLAHAGRTTQVWDAEIRSGDTSRSIALFRRTQMLLCSTNGGQI